MIKFTKKEISLCKQVAGKHKKEIRQGDWVLDSDNKSWLISDVELWNSSRPGLENTISYGLEPINKTQEPEIILGKEEIEKYPALWTISDCLEFLRKKGFYLSINTLGEYWTCLIYKHIFNEKNENIGPRIFFQEKTLLITCLKAVLAVLGEAK